MKFKMSIRNMSTFCSSNYEMPALVKEVKISYDQMHQDRPPCLEPMVRIEKIENSKEPFYKNEKELLIELASDTDTDELPDESTFDEMDNEPQKMDNSFEVHSPEIEVIDHIDKGEEITIYYPKYDAVETDFSPPSTPSIKTNGNPNAILSLENEKKSAYKEISADSTGVTPDIKEDPIKITVNSIHHKMETEIIPITHDIQYNKVKLEDTFENIEEQIFSEKLNKRKTAKKYSKKCKIQKLDVENSKFFKIENNVQAVLDDLKIPAISNDPVAIDSSMAKESELQKFDELYAQNAHEEFTENFDKSGDDLDDTEKSDKKLKFEFQKSKIEKKPELFKGNLFVDVKQMKYSDAIILMDVAIEFFALKNAISNNDFILLQKLRSDMMFQAWREST